MSNLPEQLCGLCGQRWFTTHVCPNIHKPVHHPLFNPVDIPVKYNPPLPVPVSEEDVRRIVREEIANFMKERFIK